MLSVPLSVLDLSSVRKGWSSGDALRATIEVAQAADRLGAARYWLAEHHNMQAVAATNPPVMMAEVASRTERIRVGSGGVMLPNHSPYVIAEQFALLEALHPGRIDLGIGRAPGADRVTAWALRRSQEGLGHEDFDEHVRLVSAWLGPHGVRVGMGTTLTATPAATSYPEIWLLGSSDYSARLAAKLGMRYAYAGHFGQFDPAAVISLYKESFRPSEELAEPWAMLCTSALVGETHEEAVHLAGPSTIQWINLRRDHREPIVSPEEAATRLADMGQIDVLGTKVYGTADEVTAELERQVADTDADELMVMTTEFEPATRIATLEALLA